MRLASAGNRKEKQSPDHDSLANNKVKNMAKIDKDFFSCKSLYTNKILYITPLANDMINVRIEDYKNTTTITISFSELKRAKRLLKRKLIHKFILRKSRK